MNLLINKIESYGFSCEAGPLTKCVHWGELKSELAAAQAALAQVQLDKAEYDALKAKLGSIEAAGRELPEEPVVIVDSLVAGKQSFDWPLVEKVSYDKLRDYAAALRVRADTLERDMKAGWGAFYRLRKSVGELKYPGMDGVIKLADAAIKEQT